jgi:hypothetical protein
MNGNSGGSITERLQEDSCSDMKSEHSILLF